MGGSTPNSLPSFRWNFIRRDDSYQIYQNQYGVLAERHMILNDPKLDETDELESYYYRYATKKPIVKIYKADYQARKDFCSNYKNIEVFTEYIPFRLAEVRTLSHVQGLYVLSECLIGFYELFARLGAFAIDETLIGFNTDGQVRVWHSPNFAKNHFDIDGVILVSTINPHDFDRRMVVTQQQSMVDNIWTAISRYTLFNSEFSNKLLNIQRFDFKSFKEIVDNEIRRVGYVPCHLNFPDKNGIISQSRISNQNSTMFNR